jgi:hypothetical protein
MRTACHSCRQLLDGFKVESEGLSAAPCVQPLPNQPTDMLSAGKLAVKVRGRERGPQRWACRGALGTLSCSSQQHRGRGVAVACRDVPPTLPACSAPATIAVATRATAAAAADSGTPFLPPGCHCPQVHSASGLLVSPTAAEPDLGPRPQVYCVCEVPGFGRLCTEPSDAGPTPDDPTEWEQVQCSTVQ